MSGSVNLRLGTGQLFECITLPDSETTLAEFLDTALKDLEVKAIKYPSLNSLLFIIISRTLCSSKAEEWPRLTFPKQNFVVYRFRSRDPPRLLIFSYLCGYVWTQVFHINWWLYFVVLEGSGTGQIGVKDFRETLKHGWRFMEIIYTPRQPKVQKIMAISLVILLDGCTRFHCLSDPSVVLWIM